MRKSRDVPLTLLAAAALASIGCHDGPRSCVDAQHHLLPDSYCEEHHGGGFFYVYGGSSGGHIGDSVVGAHESGASFGGFGHGGGDGGE
jgi:hypothetical protein